MWQRLRQMTFKTTWLLTTRGPRHSSRKRRHYGLVQSRLLRLRGSTWCCQRFKKQHINKGHMSVSIGQTAPALVGNARKAGFIFQPTFFITPSDRTHNSSGDPMAGTWGQTAPSEYNCIWRKMSTQKHYNHWGITIDWKLLSINNFLSLSFPLSEEFESITFPGYYYL